MLKEKSRCWMLELYDDSPAWTNSIELLGKQFDNVAFICHDKDDCKKHYHAVIVTKNPIWNTSIADKLMMDVRFIERVRNRDKALRYLVHADNSDKYQYSVDELYFSNSYMEKLFDNAMFKDNLSEAEKVLLIIDYLDKCCGLVTYRDFIKIACDLGVYDAVRRNNYLMCKLIVEHNNHFS